MAAATLKSLTLTAFRGSSATFKLPFETNRKLTLLYGENGTGKTTICDAFEFLAKGNIGSLEERGMGAGLAKYWPTAAQPATAVSVILETHSSTCTGTISGTKVAVSPETARPRAEILRHRRILKLMEAQPKDRYEEIARFIDIDAFEKSEETLRQLGKSLAGEKQQVTTAEQENLAVLLGYFENAGSPAGLNPVTWAEKKLAEPAESLDGDISAIGKLRSAFEGLRLFPEKLEQRSDAIASAQAAADAADQGQLTAIAAAGDAGGDKLNLLVAGDAFLEAHTDLSECPLCESAENIHGLGAAIKSRLSQLEVLQTATQEWRKQHGALESAKAALQQVEADCLSAIAGFAAARAAHTWKTGINLPADPAPSDISALQSWLDENLLLAESWATVEAAWRDESQSRAQLRTVLERYQSNTSRVQELQILIPKMDEALSQCVAERKAFTDGIMTDIAQQVGELYELVHPGEGLNKIALELDPKKRASLDLKAQFSSQQAPPQAYFSQSHLDTLGLCVFLALALRDQPEATILVLDDVLSSVDEPHVDRVIEMIYEVSTKFQHTIVTTHYRPWREKFRWGLLRPDKVCQFVELTKWSLTHGLALSGSIPEIVRLKSLLVDPTPDVQAICGKAGVILEAMLDFLTLKYGCAVPRRQGGYTLGDLLPNINGKLLAALRVEVRDHAAADPAVVAAVELKPILDEIMKIASARNVLGAHFNPNAFDLYPADGIKFAKQVEQLADALVCPEHGWPSRDKSGSYWENGGGTRRLHPLKKPS